MSEQPRDWDRELAAIDRAIEAQGPGAPVPRSTPGPAHAPLPPPSARPSRRSTAFAWFVVLLGVVLALALPLWPYPNDCGLQLVFFLGAIAVTFLIGLWGSVVTWRARSGLGHLLALLVVAWAAVLAASEVLPRTGYARESLAWSCPDAPAPAAPAPQGAPQAGPPAPEGAPTRPEP